jgi:hypothetical protein
MSKDLLNKWDEHDITIEGVVSRLLHMQPTENNFFQGIREVKLLIQKTEYEQRKKHD